MARIPAGILGRVSGKVGDVVGATWKGIPYIRQYVIPANPNTALQQTERSLFADLVSLAKAALGPVLQPFWDPFLKSNSGWAHFIGINRLLYSTADDYSTVHMAEGQLEGSLMTSCMYGAGSVDCLFSTGVLGNGDANDDACFFVYDEEHKVGFFSASTKRSSGACSVPVGTGRTAAKLNAWLFFVDDKNNPTMVSYSDHSDVS